MSAECLTAPFEVPYLEVQLGRIALVSAQEMGWYQEESSNWMDVYLGTPTDIKVGEIEIHYNYAARYARIHTALAVQRKGIGSEIYTAVPFLPLPGGENFMDSGFRLRTDGHSRAANGLWESLVRNGLAKPIDQSRQHYEMLPTITPPGKIVFRRSSKMLSPTSASLVT